MGQVVQRARREAAGAVVEVASLEEETEVAEMVRVGPVEGVVEAVDWVARLAATAVVMG